MLIISWWNSLNRISEYWKSRTLSVISEILNPIYRFGEILFEKVPNQDWKDCTSSLPFLPPSNFAVFDSYFLFGDVLLRWLDTVFQGQYLPSLSINNVAINKDLEIKIASTVVLDNDEFLLWSGLQWHRSCHGNEMVSPPILLAAVFLNTWNCSSKIVHGSFSEICNSVIAIFWDEVFIVINTVKNGQSWRMAVICRKRSPFNMQFHLVVVSIFLKTYAKDHGDC